jgi:sugar O-acyltransferase (sialic acid O-acetyltransferase NeuD family)
MSRRKTDIVFLGGGGHAKVLIDLVLLSAKYNILGVLDGKLSKGSQVSCIPILGDDNLLPELYEKGLRNVCIAIGSTRSNSVRMKLYDKVKEMGFTVPALTHPGTIIANDVLYAEGVQVMAGAVIQTATQVGENTIINTAAVVDHDCRIGKHVHICPGVVMSGGCLIDDQSFVGAGATVIQGIRIGKGSVVGAGSVVVKDLPENSVVKGIPAR